MKRRFSDEELSALRNILPIRFVIEKILTIPSKEVEGIFRFVCPCCHESQTAVNPKTNLSRCFLCKKNFNTIEIYMTDRRASFVEAVKALLPCVPTQAASGMLKSAKTADGLRQ
jgi:DNA primase